MKQKRTILVIDDEKAVREAVADILELEGLSVLTAHNGESGVALYKEQQADIGMIILDLSMPGLTGQETLARLQAINPDVVILISSGYSGYEVTDMFADLNVTGLLQKPYNALHLINTVRKYLTE